MSKKQPEEVADPATEKEPAKEKQTADEAAPTEQWPTPLHNPAHPLHHLRNA